MRINKINNNLNRFSQNFKSTHRAYVNDSLKGISETDGLISTYTYMFRDDLNWQELIKIINSSFADSNKVNVYSLACSDGSEAYTTAIMLKEYVNNSEKYFPIIAVDKDEEIINFAKNYKINLTVNELRKIDSNIVSGNVYFNDKSKRINISGEGKDDNMKYSYSASEDLKQNIKFKLGDILKTIENFKDDGNSIIMCRNVFPYLSTEDNFMIHKTLLKNMKPGSLFVIGSFDYKTLFHCLLEREGFKRLRSFVYQKI